MRLEVDMQPRCSAFTGDICRLYHHASSDALSSHPGIDTGVEDKRVDTSVPGDVDEANQPFIRIGPYMCKAAR